MCEKLEIGLLDQFFLRKILFLNPWNKKNTIEIEYITKNYGMGSAILFPTKPILRPLVFKEPIRQRAS